MQYLDVDLEIEPIARRDYRVIVRSPAGEVRATMRFPFDELALERHLNKGDALKALGRTAEAELAYQKARELGYQW